MIEAPQTKNAIAPAPVPGIRWPEAAAEFGASASCSAACYEQIEHIRIFPMIVPERELGKIERQILFRDVVKTADDTTLEQGPKTTRFRRVRFRPVERDGAPSGFWALSGGEARAPALLHFGG